MEMPDRLKRRPQFRGLPVPYTTHVVDGTPDFKVNSEPHRQECLVKRLCGACGEPLGRYTAFMGGTSCIEQRLFIDAGMHRDCAEYAFATCPHYTGRVAYGDTDPSQHYTIPMEVPQEVCLYVTRSWRLVSLNGTLAIQAGPAEEIITKKRIKEDL